MSERMGDFAMRWIEAKWDEGKSRWRIKPQVDGERRDFTCSKKDEGCPNVKCSEKCKKGKIIAERKADKWIADISVDENTRCGELLDQFISDLKLTAGTSHYNTSEYYVRAYIKPRLYAKKIGKLTQHDLQQILDHAYSKPVKGGKLSAKTLKNIRGAIMAFMKYCRSKKVTAFHPDTLTVPQGAKKGKKTILGAENIITLFSVDTTLYRGKVVKDRYINAYRFAVITGMRPGEIVAFKNEHIVGENRITISESINTHNELTGGKNDNAERTYMMGYCARKVYNDQKAMLMMRGEISPYIFPGEDLGYAKQRTVYNAWKRYCKANGITKATTPYELRHTFVSVNTEMPDALKDIFLGHSENMDTHGIYGHEKTGDIELAAEYVDSAFKKILGW